MTEPEFTYTLPVLSKAEIELRDMRTDLQNIRGLLSAADCLPLGDEVAPAIELLLAEFEGMRRELADLRALFDLQQTRMTEAVELWRAEAPEERGNVLPDLGALLTWLLDRDAKTRTVVEAAKALSGSVDNQSQHYAEDELAAAIDDLEGNYP